MSTYQAQLKEAYKQRIQVQMNADVQNAKLKPWRAGAALQAAGAMALQKTKRRRKAYPKTPLEKLKRRLYIGKISGKMDLACRSRWTPQDISLHSQDHMDEADANGVTNVSAKTLSKRPKSSGMPGKVKSSDLSKLTTMELNDSVRMNMAKSQIICTNWKPLHGEDTYASNPEYRFEIRLEGIPADVFKISSTYYI